MGIYCESSTIFISPTLRDLFRGLRRKSQLFKDHLEAAAISASKIPAKPRQKLRSGKNLAKNLLKDVRHLQILAWNIATLHRTSPQSCGKIPRFYKLSSWDSLAASGIIAWEHFSNHAKTPHLPKVELESYRMSYLHVGFLVTYHRNPNNYPISKYRLGNIKLHVHMEFHLIFTLCNFIESLRALSPSSHLEFEDFLGSWTVQMIVW